MLYPLLMRPVLHVRVWGGTKLRDVLGKTLPDQQPYGESWEVHDTSLVDNGPHTGRTVRSLIDEFGSALIGRYPPAEGMPLLLKFLDSDQWLSIQVHPDDAQARRLEGEPRGKNEAWIILQADANAQLIAGVRLGRTPHQLAAAIQDGTLEQHLEFHQPRTGDIFYVQARTIHALGPGLLVYEIQQSSDVTYRLYDWNRAGVDGKPRPLHVAKGLLVSDLKRHLTPGTAQGTRLLETPYFTVDRHVLAAGSVTIASEGRFHILTTVRGEATLCAGSAQIALSLGRTCLIPAALGEVSLSGTGVVLHSQPPVSASRSL